MPLQPYIPKTVQPIQPPKIEDPVARSIAKPDAFAKPASMGKAGAPTNQKATKPTRIRTMDWKRGRGRPRKTLRDIRDVHFF